MLADAWIDSQREAWRIGVDESEIPPVKDEAERLIPSAWRPTFVRIVDALVRRDYRLQAGVPGVAPVSEDTAAHIRDYVQDYGATLAALPEESWETSLCHWTGSHWDALVDLWTEEEGRSDLVLEVRVRETDDGCLVNVHMVYVP